MKWLLDIILVILLGVFIFLYIKEKRTNDNSTEALKVLFKKDYDDKTIIEDSKNNEEINRYLLYIKNLYVKYLQTKRLNDKDRAELQIKTIAIIPIASDMIDLRIDIVKKLSMKLGFEKIIDNYNAYSIDNQESLQELINYALSLSMYGGK